MQEAYLAQWLECQTSNMVLWVQFLGRDLITLIFHEKQLSGHSGLIGIAKESAWCTKLTIWQIQPHGVEGPNKPSKSNLKHFSTLNSECGKSTYTVPCLDCKSFDLICFTFQFKCLICTLIIIIPQKYKTLPTVSTF